MDRGRGGFGRGGFDASRGRGFAPGRGAPRGRGGPPPGPGVMPATFRPSDQDLFRKNHPGTSGQLLPVITNYFALNFEPEHQCDLHKYRVEIGFFSRLRGEVEEGVDDGECSSSSDSISRPVEPAAPPVLRRNYDRILDKFLETDPRFKDQIVARAMPLIYTKEAIDVKQPPSKVELVVDGKLKDFFVKLYAIKESDLRPVMLFEYYSESKLNFPEGFATVNRAVMKTAMDRTFFKDRNRFYDLADRVPGEKMDFIQGIIGTVRNSELGPLLNIHLKTGIKLSENMQTMDVVYSKFLNVGEGQMPPPAAFDRFARFISNLKVFTTHVAGSRNRTYLCGGIEKKMPQDLMITIKKNDTEVQCSLQEYFADKYNIKLKAFPLLKIKHKFVEFLPMELCKIEPNQFLNSKALDYPDIQQQLLFKSTHTPDVYFEKVSKFSNRLAENQNNYITEFGLCLNPQPISFDARVLNPVRRINDQRNSRYFKPGRLNWALFCLDGRIQNGQLNDFAGQLVQKAREKGMAVEPPCVVQVVPLQGIDTLEKVFSNINSQLFEKNRVSIVVVVLSKSDPRVAKVYQHVKRASETTYGFITQCVNSEIFRRIPMGYHENLLLKINSKLGGLNSSYSENAFDFMKTIDLSKTLIFGVDIAANTSFGDFSSERSFVGLVSQFGPLFRKMYSTCESQRLIQNVIVDIGKPVKKHIENYKEEMGDYPSHVIMYRAGISRMDTAFEKECLQIKNALSPYGHHITLTLILVNKMTDTRFALTKPQARGNKTTFNVPAGTVVDRYIIDPDRWMFYLNSHFSPLGTSKPVAYWINQDDSGMQIDEIQQLTYALCANSPRTQDLLAWPVVVRNADLCAQRGRYYSEATIVPADRSKPVQTNPLPKPNVVNKPFFA